MPYAVDHAGIYKIVNTATQQCYVGQSRGVKKRVKEHFRLLGLGVHPNRYLQRSYNKYGSGSFTWSIEALCENAQDLDDIENAFLRGDADFDDTPVVFNIANEAKAGMKGRKHTDESKRKVSASKLANPFNSSDPEYRKRLREGQRKRLFEDEKFVAKIKYIVDNPDLTYAERGRQIGLDTSSVRKLALKYEHLKGVL